MIVLTRQGFGFKTDLFETNILNLAVVVAVVITFVGDALRTLLDQRREIILLTLQEVDQKARRVQAQLERARELVETSRLRAQEIQTQTIKTIEQEEITIQEQLKEDLARLQESGRQRIQLERQRIIQTIAQQVANITLIMVENTLLTAFGRQGKAIAKQKELNDMHVRDTFRQLKR
jgi:F-type H+-transporting ATPase subunit b